MDTPSANLIPETHRKAAGVLKRLVNNRLVGDRFMSGKVEITTGLHGEFGDHGNDRETLQIKLTDAQVEAAPAQAKEALLKLLADIPPIKDKVQLESPAERVTRLKKQMEGFIAQGADIPKEYLQWTGFDGKNAEKDRQEDHALRVNRSDYGIDVNIRVNKVEGEHPPTTDRVVKNITERLPEIRALLAKRLEKYTPGLTPEQRKLQQEQVAKLDVSVTQSDSDDWAHVRVEFRSPEQVALRGNEYDKGGQDSKTLAAAKETNPLHVLNTEQLGKAMGRSLLHSSEKAHEVFPLIAGREDMKRAVCKSLCRLKAAKPELSKDIDAFMNDDMFKPHHTWDKAPSERPTLKELPAIHKDLDKPGVMTVNLHLPKGTLGEVIAQIAALDPAAQPSQPPSAALANVDLGEQARLWVEKNFPVKVTELDLVTRSANGEAQKDKLGFATVDNVTLIGPSAPDLSAAVTQLMNAVQQSQAATDAALTQVERLTGKKPAEAQGQAPASVATAFVAAASEPTPAQTAQPQTGDPLNPKAVRELAENVVLKVEEAYTALSSSTAPLPESVAAPIKMAHEAVMSAVKLEAASWRQRTEASRQTGPRQI